MISQELRARIKKLKLISRRFVKSTIVGDYLSAFKGMGMEFHQLREYQPGDEVRLIDWNSFAKSNKFMVKQFIEERDRTVILVIDISASSGYSSKDELRQDTISQVASVLAMVASENKDKVGALFFSDHVEKWIPPSRKASSIGLILEDLLKLRPTAKKTSIKDSLRFLADLKKSNAIIFFLSDWIDEENSYSKLLKVVSCKHDFIAVRLLDDCEKSLPNIGLIDVCDPETGEMTTISLSDQKYASEDSFAKKSLNDVLATRIQKQKKLFNLYKIDLLDLRVGLPFINDLTKFFHKRIRRSI